MITRPCIRLMVWLLLFNMLSALHADPRPGDVFREYRWSQNRWWQRITYPEVASKRAREFLPNAVNAITLADLAAAKRVEVQLELLQSHAGTIGHALRVNGGDWISIPPSKHIPGDAGSEPGTADRWLAMRYPTVEVPLEAVTEGRNTFEFTCKPGSGLGKFWPQSIVYGVIFRVYYSSEKPAPSGRVHGVLRKPGRAGTADLVVEPIASPGAAIRRVDFLARYRGYDWRGEGVRERWHYHTVFGELQRHAGSAFSAPWALAWDVRGIPAQDAPVQIAARIEDDRGLCTMTEPATIGEFRGMPEVRIFAAHAVPPHWQTRAGHRQSCTITLPDDISGLREATLVLASWNGDQADAIGINDTTLVRNVGRNHDLSYDELTVPITALRGGNNEFFTVSNTKHHGIEVLWPGAVLIARFARTAAAH